MMPNAMAVTTEAGTPTSPTAYPQQTHRHGSRNEIGYQTDQAETHASEDKDQQERDDSHRYDGAEQHFFYVPLNRVSPDNRHSGSPGFQTRGVLTEPGLRAIVELYLLIGGQASQHHRYPRCRAFDVDEIVQVEADRQRKLVEQKILCSEIGVVQNTVKVRIVAIEILVQALHDAGCLPLVCRLCRGHRSPLLATTA